MGNRFAEVMFTDTVNAFQQQMGSFDGYRQMVSGDAYNHRLSSREAGFIGARDSFYMASVSESGWPYVQHRGGKAGFVRVLDEQTIGFADFSGNRQYVSTGNLTQDDRVALFFMNYPERTRLKMLGRVEIIDAEDPRMSGLVGSDTQGRVERGMIIRLEGFDWNCPQHITPRYTEAELGDLHSDASDAVERQEVDLDETDLVLGDGPLELVVTGIRILTPEVRAFRLARADGEALPEISAGAHLEVPVPAPGGRSIYRKWSIASDPARRDFWEIAVQRKDEGEGGSVAAHRHLAVGSVLNCSLPINQFALHTGDQPIVLIGGGIGITPLRAMLAEAHKADRDVRLHFSARGQQQAAYLQDLVAEVGRRIRFYDSTQARMNVADILSCAADDSVFYVCGPADLTQAVIQQAAKLGIPAERVRTESFAG
jgi:ferredoxin-NADP reductase/predicted pyridoxine 5'-phosphate oxidase superfamily flavin-nucleotide-binding protein